MKRYISEAIVMRVKEFGESDLLISFFTRDRGQVRGVAKGGRRSCKRFVNCLDLFTLVKLEYGLSREGALPLLQSGRLIDGYPNLRGNFSAISIASFMVEITEILYPQGVVEERAFHLLKEAFAGLSGGVKTPVMALLFEGKSLALSGFGIDTEKCCHCGRSYKGEGRAVFVPKKGGISCLQCGKPSPRNPVMTPDGIRVLAMIQNKNMNDVKEVMVPDRVVRELKPVMKLHREYHLERPLKTAKYVD
jgi:DNA repair protein RecO (recombination protein O)